MKLFSLFLLLFLNSEVVELSPGFSKVALQKAMTAIANYLAERSYSVLMVKNEDISDVIEAALVPTIPHIVVNLASRDSFYWKYVFQINSSAIVTVSSVKSLEKFNRLTLWAGFSRLAQQVFVCFKTGTFDELSMLSSQFSNPIMKKEYFLIEEGESIRLLTFVYFFPETCVVPRLVEVNRFDKLTNKWAHRIFEIEKYSNLHGCHFIFLVELLEPDIILESNTAVRTNTLFTKCTGFLCAIIQDFGSSLNYTYQL